MLKVMTLSPVALVALLSMPAPMVSATPAQCCADSLMAASRLEHHALPAFADTTADAAEWRAIAGVEQVDWSNAGVVRDEELCTRINSVTRAWHDRAEDPSVFGDYTVYALRIGPYYAAFVDYPYQNSTGWSTLLILAPDDLRVLHDARF